MRNRSLFIILCCFLYAGHICLGAVLPVVPINDTTNGIDLRTYSEILPDSHGNISPVTVLLPAYSNSFKEFDKKQISPVIGFYWLRLKVENQSGSNLDYVTGFGNTVDLVTVYENRNGILNQTAVTGSSIPSSQKEIKYGKDNIVVLSFQPHEIKELYIRVENHHDFSKQMFNYILEYYKIYSYKQFEQTYLGSRVMNGIFYGAILIMFLYNLFIAFSLRSRDYYTYILFISLFFFFNLFSDGYATELIFYNYPNFDRLFRIMEMPLMFLSYMIFCFRFLKLYQYQPKIEIWFKVMGLLFLLTYLPPIFNNWWVSRNAMLVLLFIGVALVYTASIISYRKGYKPAIYFTVANTLLIISSVLYSLNLLLVIKVENVDFLLQISSVIEISIFSLGLANRIKIAEKEKHIAQENSIRMLEEKEKIISSQNIKLEIKVKERTEELEAMNGNLTSLNEELNITLEKIEEEKAKSDRLLLNILPEPVANELKEKGKATPHYYPQATILFADFVNFTRFAETNTPEETTRKLDELFLEFDKICTDNKLEKIKTIGDCYMLAGGLPIENSTNAINAVKAATEMLKSLHTTGWEIRIGIHSGPVVAGVIGINKFAYDVWGDTVNIAARMEQTSESNRINISQQTYDLVKHHFECTYRGRVNAKNKGEIDMYFVNQD